MHQLVLFVFQSKLDATECQNGYHKTLSLIAMNNNELFIFAVMRNETSWNLLPTFI